MTPIKTPEDRAREIASTIWVELRVLGVDGPSLTVRPYVDAIAKEIAEALRERDEEINRITFERDLAIAHDRQPYPTAEAYELACKTREILRSDLAEARASVAVLKKSIEYYLVAEKHPSAHPADLFIAHGKLIDGITSLPNSAKLWMAERDVMREALKSECWCDNVKNGYTCAPCEALDGSEARRRVEGV